MTSYINGMLLELLHPGLCVPYAADFVPQLTLKRKKRKLTNGRSPQNNSRP
jgi:hypothetical protein